MFLEKYYYRRKIISASWLHARGREMETMTWKICIDECRGGTLLPARPSTANNFGLAMEFESNYILWQWSRHFFNWEIFICFDVYVCFWLCISNEFLKL